MSLSKSESNINLARCMCRLVKLLPSGQVTFGSGCIVILRLKGESTPSAYLITTTQVVTKNHILGESSIIVQFQDGLQFQLKFESKDAADLPDPIPGRVLEDTEGTGVQVSFIILPLNKFDSRVWFKRKLKPLEKRAILCSHQSDETLQTSISNKHILCHVISDDRKAGGFYITEPSCLSFGKDTREFALSSVSDPDCATPTKTIKDFTKDEKPKGALLLNADGRFVGMLAVASSEERKLYPVFLPTLTSDKSVVSHGNGKLNNTAMYLRNTSDITSQSDEGNKGSDKANTNGKNRQENENNDTSSTCKKLPSNQTTSKDNGRRDCASSEVQSSASPTSNPLHLEYHHSLQQPDYANKSSSDATVGNGSVVEEDQDHPHSLHELDSASNESSLQENSGSDSTVEEEPVPPHVDQDQQKHHCHSLPEPDSASNESSLQENSGNGSAVEEDTVPPCVDQDQQKDHPYSLSEPDSASNESSLQENSGNGSAVEEDPVPPCIDQDQHKDHPHILPEPDNANESSLQDSPTSSESSLKGNSENEFAQLLEEDNSCSSKSSLLDELSDSSAFLPEQDNTSSLSSSLANPCSLLEPANANRENALQPKSSDINPAQDQRVNQMTCGLPVRVNTNNEGPLQYNPGSAALDQEDAVLPRVNGNDPTRGSSLGSINENSQARPQVLATQHSCHEQPSEPTGLRDQDEVPYPQLVSDPNPSKHTRSFTERSREYSRVQPRANRTLLRSSSDVTSYASSQTSEIAITPRTRHSSSQLEHVTSGSSVKEKILSKVSIMDVICLHLDRSACPDFRGAALLTARWEHLADYFKVKDEIKRQCKSYTHLSPSEAMFQYLYVSYNSLTIGTLKKYLLDPQLARKDVVHELEKNRELPDNATITDLCDKHAETLCNVCLNLDDKSNVRQWYHLGLKIGIMGDTLRRFKDHSGESPSKLILEKIGTWKPDLRLTDIKLILQEFEGFMPGISNVLDDLPAEGTIEMILEDLDVVERITTLLDLDDRIWWRFGKKLEMDRLELNSLRQESPPSPTKLILEHIVGKEPNLTMKSFLEALVYIKRNDVVKELKKFYFANDIDAIIQHSTNFALQGQISLL